LKLDSQHRLAAKILKVGLSRVKIDPERAEDVELAITREEIKRLIHEGAIRVIPKKGISRSRKRAFNYQKKKGRHRGPGRRGGSLYARISRKELWMRKIRALRKELQRLKQKRLVAKKTYVRLYRLASSGVFESVSDMHRYIETKGLWRRR